jgi:hypothetical protein
MLAVFHHGQEFFDSQPDHFDQLDRKVCAQSPDKFGLVAQGRIVTAGFPNASIAPHEILSAFRQAADVPEVVGRESALEDGADEIRF